EISIFQPLRADLLVRNPARMFEKMQPDHQPRRQPGSSLLGVKVAEGFIEAVYGRRPPKGAVLDMDSSVSPTHGEQENSVWNGHYACTCYHPLFVFNQFGDLERCTLRPGNVHSADGWESALKPV